MSPWLKPTGENPLRTAVRFPMKLALHMLSKDEHYDATTEDISANGLLFVGERLPEVDSPIEFVISMPSDAMGSSNDVTVHCRGRVVRREQEGNQQRAAAVIDEYYLKA